jgi:hypothetical protein
MSNLETNLNVAATHSKLDLSDLMIAIFQAADPIYAGMEDVTEKLEYVKSRGSDIDRLGRVLKFLQLAEDSPQSVFGWTPTAQLIRIVAERADRPAKASRKHVTNRERAIIAPVLQVAGGWAEQTYTDDFVFNVLNGLGLLCQTHMGECKPTSFLREMLEELFEA